ncbi:DUF748 domain-containing protein [Seongchinamella unica]|uniref:DUF748 domain-containing protein n=1 Tax=Seongchinamella unica TaxID=2547392 RepID=UPI001404BF2E|nr:DUF748 domain-containing protein [Seongchinamella unica]
MLKIAVRILVAIYIAYVALVTLIIIPAANFIAPWYVDREYGRELKTDIILFNPFSLSAEVRGAQLREVTGEHFVSFDGAIANLSLSSLWDQGLVMDEISIAGLNAHIRHLHDSVFNFSDLLPADDQNAAEPGGGSPALTIGRLAFGAELITLTDAAREKPFSTYYHGIDIVVTDLSTVLAEGKPYRIRALAEDGGELYLEGNISLPEASSSGKLALSRLSLHTFWRFAEPWLNFELHDGTASLAGNYRLSWADAFSYRLEQGSFQVSKLRINALDPNSLPDTGAGLGSLQISGIEIDGDRQHVEVARVGVEGAGIEGWMEDDRISLPELFVIDLPETGAERPQPPAEQEAGWTARVADIRLDDGNITWRSPFTAPATVVAAPIAARVQALSWPLTGRSPLQLALTLNERTRLVLDGALDLGSGAGDINYQLDKLSVPLFNPNLPSALKATISSGDVDLDGVLTLDEFLPVAVQSNGQVSDFSGTMEGSEQALTRWESVRWENLRVNLQQRAVRLEKLLIHDYEGRVHIAEDGSINASKVWQQEVGQRAEEIAEDMHLNEPWQLDLPEIFISDSAIDFMDESLPIPFRTVIGDVNGEVLNLSTDQDSVAAVEIGGTVDGYAPVQLKGSAAPFRAPPFLDLGLTFTGVDLVLLTPYSGTYAGYNIEQGLLNLDLHYSLEDGYLRGKNDVIVDQLKLGDKVESDKALDLPLELALALLTDLNGIIDLKVPIEGDVNDPEFSLGSVIAGAFINLLTKAVTAPFNLLASLVGSDEDLQRIAFPAGSSDLNATAATKLDQLGQALAQRPNLSLVISGRAHPDLDRERLQRAALEAQLVAEGLAAEEIARRGPDYIAAIEERYRALGASGEDNSFSGQLAAVRDTMPVTDEQLLQLARDRGVAVKDYLVNQAGISADRAVINQQARFNAESHTYSGVELELDI